MSFLRLILLIVFLCGLSIFPGNPALAQDLGELSDQELLKIFPICDEYCQQRIINSLRDLPLDHRWFIWREPKLNRERLRPLLPKLLELLKTDLRPEIKAKLFSIILEVSPQMVSTLKDEIDHNIGEISRTLEGSEIVNYSELIESLARLGPLASAAVPLLMKRASESPKQNVTRWHSYFALIKIGNKDGIKFVRAHANAEIESWLQILKNSGIPDESNCETYFSEKETSYLQPSIVKTKKACATYFWEMEQISPLLGEFSAELLDVLNVESGKLNDPHGFYKYSSLAEHAVRVLAGNASPDTFSEVSDFLIKNSTDTRAFKLLSAWGTPALNFVTTELRAAPFPLNSLLMDTLGEFSEDADQASGIIRDVALRGHPRIIVSSVETLLAIDGKESRQVLKNLLPELLKRTQSSEPETRENAVWALSKLPPRMSKSALSIAARVLDPSTKEFRRIEYYSLLEAIGPEAVSIAPKLIDRLINGDRDEAYYITPILKKFPMLDPDLLSKLADAIGDCTDKESTKLNYFTNSFFLLVARNRGPLSPLMQSTFRACFKNRYTQEDAFYSVGLGNFSEFTQDLLEFGTNSAAEIGIFLLEPSAEPTLRALTLSKESKIADRAIYLLSQPQFSPGKYFSSQSLSELLKAYDENRNLTQRKYIIEILLERDPDGEKLFAELEELRESGFAHLPPLELLEAYSPKRSAHVDTLAQVYEFAPHDSNDELPSERSKRAFNLLIKGSTGKQVAGLLFDPRWKRRPQPLFEILKWMGPKASDAVREILTFLSDSNHSFSKDAYDTLVAIVGGPIPKAAEINDFKARLDAVESKLQADGNLKTALLSFLEIAASENAGPLKIIALSQITSHQTSAAIILPEILAAFETGSLPKSYATRVLQIAPCDSFLLSTVKKELEIADASNRAKLLWQINWKPSRCNEAALILSSYANSSSESILKQVLAAIGTFSELPEISFATCRQVLAKDPYLIDEIPKELLLLPPNVIEAELEKLWGTYSTMETSSADRIGLYAITKAFRAHTSKFKPQLMIVEKGVNEFPVGERQYASKLLESIK